MGYGFMSSGPTKQTSKVRTAVMKSGPIEVAPQKVDTTEVAPQKVDTTRKRGRPAKAVVEQKVEPILKVEPTEEKEF